MSSSEQLLLLLLRPLAHSPTNRLRCLFLLPLVIYLSVEHFGNHQRKERACRIALQPFAWVLCLFWLVAAITLTLPPLHVPSPAKYPHCCTGWSGVPLRCCQLLCSCRGNNFVFHLHFSQRFIFPKSYYTLTAVRGCQRL